MGPGPPRPAGARNQTGPLPKGRACFQLTSSRRVTDQAVPGAGIRKSTRFGVRVTALHWQSRVTPEVPNNLKERQQDVTVSLRYFHSLNFRFMTTNLPNKARGNMIHTGRSLH